MQDKVEVNQDGLPVLVNPEIGYCPSCNKEMALPVGMVLTKMQVCPKCGAWSYGKKWRKNYEHN